MSNVKFRVWKDENVFFRLIQNDNEITLIACDYKGEKLYHGNILAIQKDGTLFRCLDVNKDIGLLLDPNGCIKLLNE